MSSGQHAPYYFVPSPSQWPVCAGATLLLTMIGAAAWVNGVPWGMYANLGGILLTLVVLYNWFGVAIHESESGQYNERVDVSYRWSMSWFIFSEVMFFGAFFGALFYARSITMPWLADLDNKLLWPDFVGQWGSVGPAGTIEAFKMMTPFPIPTINTALLLSSGVTLTIAHHALLAGNRSKTSMFLFFTILLGACFMGLQAHEYIDAYSELNLKLTSGISYLVAQRGYLGRQRLVPLHVCLFVGAGARCDHRIDLASEPSSSDDDCRHGHNDADDNHEGRRQNARYGRCRKD